MRSEGPADAVMSGRDHPEEGADCEAPALERGEVLVGFSDQHPTVDKDRAAAHQETTYLFAPNPQAT